MASGTGFKVDAGIPGGNIHVDKLEGEKLLARPDLRDTEGDWFYWHFRLAGAAGKDFSCEFSSPPPIAGAGPAASFDGGATYAWLGPQREGEWRRFSCAIPAGTQDARFCVTHPYTGANLAKWLAARSGQTGLVRQILCTSRKGRPVELLRLGRARREPVCRVLLAARHHACEAMASYTLEGMLDAMLEGELARSFYRSGVEVLVLPFADRDGVEDGDQGKSRRPRDHGRDYAGKSLYPETGALREFAPEWFGKRLCAAIDLHCPWIRGEWNEHIYQVGLPDPKIWEAQQRFGAILENVRTGPLPYSPSRDLPFGTDWNNEENEGDGMSFSSWAARQPGIALSTSLEIPYAVVSDRFIDPASARLFGHDLAKALAGFLTGR